MRRDIALPLTVLMGTVLGVGCGQELTRPAFDGRLTEAALARGTPGTYELRFLDNSLQSVTTLPVGGPELVLGAHVESAAGDPAAGGTVSFEYCSLKKRPPNDITRADEAPREACRTGSATWARLANVPVNTSGDAFITFGVVQIPRTVGFRFRYAPQRNGTIAGGTSPDSNFIWVDAPALAVVGGALDAPSNVRASLVTDRVAGVAWQDNSTSETGFEVRRTSAGIAVTLGPTGMNTNSLIDDGLSSGMQYCYDVRALRRVGQKTHYSTYSNSDCVTTPALPPPSPPPPLPTAASNVGAKPVSSARLEVTWNEENTGAASFRIERSADGVASWSPVGSVSTSEHPLFSDDLLLAERLYCYRIVSLNATGESPPSTPACTAAPNGTQLTGVLVNPQTLVLNWTDNSAVEDGYEVWLHAYRPSSGCYPPGNDGYDSGTIEGQWMLVRLPPNSTSWTTAPVTDTSCDPPTQYTFFVVATRDGGTSSMSNGIAGSGVAQSPGLSIRLPARGTGDVRPAGVRPSSGVVGPRLTNR